MNIASRGRGQDGMEQQLRINLKQEGISSCGLIKLNRDLSLFITPTHQVIRVRRSTGSPAINRQFGEASEQVL